MTGFKLQFLVLLIFLVFAQEAFGINPARVGGFVKNLGREGTPFGETAKDEPKYFTKDFGKEDLTEDTAKDLVKELRKDQAKDNAKDLASTFTELGCSSLCNQAQDPNATDAQQEECDNCTQALCIVKCKSNPLECATCNPNSNP